MSFKNRLEKLEQRTKEVPSHRESIHVHEGLDGIFDDEEAQQAFDQFAERPGQSTRRKQSVTMILINKSSQSHGGDSE